MEKLKKSQVSNHTTYRTELKQIKKDLYTITVKYIIKGKELNTPLLYYRLNKRDIAIIYFNKIIGIIQENQSSLCVKNMKNWLFSIHPIRYLMKTQN